MKTTVRITVLIIACCLLMCIAAFAAGSSYTKQLTANYVGITLVVHGETVTPQDAAGNAVEPFIVDGTTYLPVRAVAEALGEEGSWDGATKTVYIGAAPEEEPAPEPEPEPTPEPEPEPEPEPTPEPTPEPVEVVISLDQISFSLYVGETKQVTATVEPQGTPVMWSSSNPAVATVDANGVVTAVAPGKIDVYAVTGSAQAFCTVTVPEPKKRTYSVSLKGRQERMEAKAIIATHMFMKRK